MGFVRDTFFGGEEKKAGKRALRSAERVATSVGEAGEEARTGIQQFSTGGQAFQQQQALSGALGPEAEAEAISAFNESPGQAFLREEGLRFIDSGAGATGGLGGGNRLRELVKFGTGLAQQSFGDRFNRLGQVAQTGLGVQRNISNLTTGTAANVGAIQQGGIASLNAGRIAGASRARTGIADFAGGLNDAFTGGVAA